MKQPLISSGSISYKPIYHLLISSFWQLITWTWFSTSSFSVCCFMWHSCLYCLLNNYIHIHIQIYVTIRSGSIAVAASTLDSLLDFMAGGILWFTHLAMKNINMYKYPIGKLRVQPVGIVIFAVIMATLGELNWFDQFLASKRFIYKCLCNVII